MRIPVEIYKETTETMKIGTKHKKWTSGTRGTENTLHNKSPYGKTKEHIIQKSVKTLAIISEAEWLSNLHNFYSLLVIVRAFTLNKV